MLNFIFEEMDFVVLEDFPSSADPTLIALEFPGRMRYIAMLANPIVYQWT